MNRFQTYEASIIQPSELQPLAVDLRTAAKMLSVSDRHLHTLKGNGTVPFFKMGNRILFSLESLKTYIAKAEKGGHNAG